MTNEWLSLLICIPIADGIIALFWVFSTHIAWKGVEFTGDSLSERELGATVIMGQLGSVMTASSVILAGIGAFVALADGNILAPERWHLSFAATWAVMSIIIVVYTMSTLPTRAPRENFVRSHAIAVLCSAASFLTVAAGVRFVFAMWSILF